MNSRTRKLSGWLLSLFLVVGFTAVPAFAGSFDLSVQPATLTVNQGQAFSLDVSIAGVTDLYAFQFDLGFDPTVLSVTNVREGAFLATGGSTFFIPGTIDNVGGTISNNADTLESAISGVNGSGVLVTFDFNALAAGMSQISIFNAILLDSNLSGLTPEIENGSVTVRAVPEPSSLLLLLGGLGGLLGGLMVRHGKMM